MPLTRVLAALLIPVVGYWYRPWLGFVLAIPFGAVACWLFADSGRRFMKAVSSHPKGIVRARRSIAEIPRAVARQRIRLLRAFKVEGGA
jgi:hypothetical protein